LLPSLNPRIICSWRTNSRAVLTRAYGGVMLRHLKPFLATTALSLSLIPGAAHAQVTQGRVVPTCASATYVAGQNAPITQDTTGLQCTGATVTPGGTQNVNLVQTNGVTQLTGAGAVGTGSERVAVGQDTNTIAGSAPGTTAAPSANIVSVTPQPSAAATSGLAPVVSSSVETGHVIKAGAGNLYTLEVSADATLSAAAWVVFVFNSMTVPAAGTVAPVACFLLPAGTTTISIAWPTPMYLGTGISVAAGTGASCFTKADSAHAYFSAGAQ